MHIGLDIGSVSVNAVLMDAENAIVEEHYVRTKGQPAETVLRVLEDVLARTPPAEVESLACTGSGGKLIARLLDAECVNEIVAQSAATAHLHPEVRTVIEIGGEDSKLILLERDEVTGNRTVRDFAMNTVCAAGTGSFLDQQASRLGVAIEQEFAELALRSKKPPRIAGRCSVFAKTDMIHLQQEATPDHDILFGLCHAMARNYTSNIAKGKQFRQPVSFQGGVAANAAMVRAFEEVLDLGDGALLIPKYFASMGAIGAVLATRKNGSGRPLGGLESLADHIRNRVADTKRHDPLIDDGYRRYIDIQPVEAEERVEAYLGVDVGSISTNVVVIDRDRNVLARRYLMTAGRPIEAVRQGIAEVGEEIGNQVTIKGAGTTGSGRYLTGDFIGADVVKNEITTHARAAASLNREVDTIFEIGGQDSKYVSLQDGAVVDFTMNKVCAAGTGSFLEEQAEKLGISIEEEFGELALSAPAPAHLGERCTVFMESDLNHHQQQGVEKPDLVAGLGYSIVYNYLNKVVEDRKVGDTIFFQGGVAANRGVKAAFEKVTGKKITVPPHHDVIGAIGAAIIAMEETPGESRFKGFDLARRRYSVESFECQDCSNNCEVKRVSIEGERPLHYGSRCGKFDEDRKAGEGEVLPRLFREREQALLNSYEPRQPAQPNGKRIGIPRITTFFELYPLWKAFFTELGLEVVLSDRTNRKIIGEGVEEVLSETCFPIKVAHGHVLNLLEKEIDYVFLPSIINMDPMCPEMERSYNCPYVQSVPYLVEAAIDFDELDVEVLQPILHMERGEKHVRQVLIRLARQLGLGKGRASRAVAAGIAAQKRFYGTIERRGAEILEGLPSDTFAMVIVSRPYNGCDSGLNLGIPEKLRALGVLAIPLDFLPLAQVDIGKDFPNMYWKYGQKILSAARVIADDPRLNAIYLTNFGCGPDSFISKFFAKELKGKPYLTIEVDEHSADVGAITRCEAFLDSLKSARSQRKKGGARPVNGRYLIVKDPKRVLYIPHMDDHGRIVGAAMRRRGVNAYVLPMADEESVALGRAHTSGKECYPCVITTGDILKKVFSTGFDPSKAAFFMPTALGPCRFGQYSRFHRMVLDDIGLHDVEILELDQTTGYHDDLAQLGMGFVKDAWSGIVVIDLLQKMARETRPYEVNPGEVDRVYGKHLAQIERALEQGRDLLGEGWEARSAFDAIPVDRSVRRPLIGIIGEIFVRCNQFSNNFIVRKIEQLGGEVSVPPLEEWMDYINHERKRDLRREGRYGLYVKEVLSETAQGYCLNRLAKPFRGALQRFYREADTSAILERAKPYLHASVRGESVLSMGRAVEYAEHQFNGIVNLAPFNCIPGTVVNALLEKFRRDHNNMPCLKMAYDGLEQTSEDTRLEAFMYQAQQNLAK